MTELKILADTADYLAVDKPAGLLTAPDRWDPKLPHLVKLLQASFGQDCVNVHRLDRDTSGVVLFAKHAAAMRVLSEQFAAHTIYKAYLALVSPAPREDAGSWNWAVSPATKPPGTMRIDPRGKQAVTDFKVLERFGSDWAWLELRPLTGRTHQLRIHSRTAGSSIVGDRLYGDAEPLLLSSIKRRFRIGKGIERPLLARLALHAYELRFNDPTDDSPRTITAPLPQELEQTLDALRRYR